MIARGRSRPGPGLDAQALQITRAISDVSSWVQRLVQRFEGLAVIAEVNLHAADVDVGPASRLQLADLAQRILLGGQEEAVSARSDGPGPSLAVATLGQPAARLRKGDRVHQSRWNALRPLRLVGECATEVGGIGQGGQSWPQHGGADHEWPHHASHACSKRRVGHAAIMARIG